MISSWQERKNKIHDTKEAQLANELGDHLVGMCKKHIEKGAKEQVNSKKWQIIKNNYGHVKIGKNKVPFKMCHTGIHTEFEKIASLFCYNRKQTRKDVYPQSIDTWYTWEGIKEKIYKICDVYNPPKELIEELEHTYVYRYSDQRECFEKALKNRKAIAELIMEFGETKEELEKQIRLILNTTDRADNNPAPETRYWNVYIDETGDYFGNDADPFLTKNKEPRNGKVVAVHVPADENEIINISKLCSDSPCGFICPNCLKNWHGREEKYQELDRIVRLISKKGLTKSDECFVLGIEHDALDGRGWLDCIAKLIVASFLKLSSIGHKTYISYFVEGRFKTGYHSSADKGSDPWFARKVMKQVKSFCDTYFSETTEIKRINFVVPDERYKKLSKSKSFRSKSSILEMPLADAAAASWNGKTPSIYERAKWNTNGLYYEDNISELSPILIPLINQIKRNEKDGSLIFHYVTKIVSKDIKNKIKYTPDYQTNPFSGKHSHAPTLRPDHLGHFADALLKPITLLPDSKTMKDGILADITKGAIQSFVTESSSGVILETTYIFVKNNIG